MFNFKNLFGSLIFLTIFLSVSFAQPPPGLGSSSKNTESKKDFVSLDGEFTIALSSSISGFSGVKPVAGTAKGGSQYHWRTPQGTFMVGYTDRIDLIEDKKEFLAEIGNGLIERIKGENGEFVSKDEIALGDHPGIEIRMRLSVGAIAVARYYLVGNRVYTLTTGWEESKNGSDQIKILDSFKLVDGKSLLAKKIEEATPKLLPQTPVVKKIKSDAEDEGLKGKVKSVTETEEDLTGTWSVSGIKISSEDFYDENGNKTRRISYDYKGNPMSISVYGFIDGMRVSSYGSVNYEYNPPPPMAPGPVSSTTEKAKKTPDNRYDTRLEYIYDDKGRLKETLSFRNNGDLTGKTVYSYDGNKLEKTSFNSEGKQNFQSIEIYDDKSNVVERTYIYPNDNRNSVYTITYQSFDEKGNWTKRTIKGLESGKRQQHYIEYRAITYYP